MRREGKTPLYKKLIEDLKKLIDEGRYKQGELLPSENDLCKTYHTTRPTVRQALAGLTNMGYIVRQQGKGSIVSEPQRGLGILTVNGITASVAGQNLKTVILEKPVKEAWPADIFFPLSDEEQKAGCLFFSRLRYINNVPAIFEETYISNVDLPRFTARNLENRSFFKILKEQYQVEVTGGEQKIWAITAGKVKGKLLKINADTPIVHMKRKLKTNIRGLNIYSWLYCYTGNNYLDDSF